MSHVERHGFVTRTPVTVAEVAAHVDRMRDCDMPEQYASDIRDSVMRSIVNDLCVDDVRLMLTAAFSATEV
jgi:hypothetical protein